MKVLSRFLLMLVFIAGFSGCSSVPSSPGTVQVPVEDRTITIETMSPELSMGEPKGKGVEIYNFAEEVLGTPYRYGGMSSSGFDCSGLVQYSHHNAGIDVPRTTAAQYEVASTVSRSELKPGDVIFFRLNRRKISHVGIYAGQGKFIHAPRTGKRVTFSELDDPYWKKRIVKAGRFY